MVAWCYGTEGIRPLLQEKERQERQKGQEGKEKEVDYLPQPVYVCMHFLEQFTKYFYDLVYIESQNILIYTFFEYLNYKKGNKSGCYILFTCYASYCMCLTLCLLFYKDISLQYLLLNLLDKHLIM